MFALSLIHIYFEGLALFYYCGVEFQALQSIGYFGMSK